MKLHEAIAQSVTIALNEFEAVGPEFREMALNMFSNLKKAIFGEFPYVYPWGMLKVFVDLFDDFTGILSGIFTRIPPLIVANIIAENLVLPKSYTYRVMKLSDAAKLPIQIIMDHGIREWQGGAVPNALSLALRWETLTKRVTAIISKIPSKIFRAFLGGSFTRILKLVFFVAQGVKMYSLVMLIWSYAKMIEGETTQKILLVKALSDQAPREKQNVPRLRRRVGGVAP